MGASLDARRGPLFSREAGTRASFRSRATADERGAVVRLRRRVGASHGRGRPGAAPAAPYWTCLSLPAPPPGAIRRTPHRPGTSLPCAALRDVLALLAEQGVNARAAIQPVLARAADPCSQPRVPAEDVHRVGRGSCRRRRGPRSHREPGCPSRTLPRSSPRGSPRRRLAADTHRVQDLARREDRVVDADAGDHSGGLLDARLSTKK